jgi:hypothetical protein
MTFNQAPGSGNMLVFDKVKPSLDVSAVKQAASDGPEADPAAQRRHETRDRAGRMEAPVLSARTHTIEATADPLPGAFAWPCVLRRLLPPALGVPALRQVRRRLQAEAPRVDRCDPGRARREERLGGLAVETD